MVKDKKGGDDSDGKKTAKPPKEKKAGKEITPPNKVDVKGSTVLNKPPTVGKPPTGLQTKNNKDVAKPNENISDSIKVNSSTPSGRFRRTTTSTKYIGKPLEWNSQKIKDADLNSNGFSCCIVLVAEESSDLSEYADFLYQAINTGVRKRFIALKGEEIAAKVFQYMTSAQMREPGEDEDSHLGRMDLWAEAIKYCLLQCKSTAANEVIDKSNKHGDTMGARSKDMLQRMSPINLRDVDEEDPGGSDAKKGTGDATAKSEKSKKEKKKDAKLAATSAFVPNTNETPNEEKQEEIRRHSSSSYTGSMKKRGEIPMPFLEQIDDVPANGSKCYIILQGFYNARLIPELKKIGAPVNGLLLLTNNEQGKKNFSIYDIEENIAGTFIPKNVLPDYVNIIQRRNSTAFKSHKNAVITQFWMELAALINNAPLQSCLHDIALLNCPLPKPVVGLDSPEGRGIFATQIFDEAAQRIYEMHVLLDWFQEYKQAVYVRQITPIEAEIPHILYERLVRQVPAECVTVPIVMECIVEQVMVNACIDKSQEVADQEPTIDLLSDNMHINLGPEWGLTAFPKDKKGVSESGSAFAFDEGSSPSSRVNFVKPIFHKPKFIRSGDYASMRTAHLPEKFGSHLASSQVTGDFHRLESILWQDLPEFSKGLYMKLLGNLNHFMYFLPPDTIRLDDMFFILHLLMSAGVETHLQKLAEKKAKEREESAIKPYSLPVPLSLLINTHGPGADVHYIPGTQLLSDHNYLTIDEEDALHFILAPTGGENEMTVSELGQTKNFRLDTPEYQAVEEEEVEVEEEIEIEVEEEGEDATNSENRRKSERPEEMEGTRRVSGKGNSYISASGDAAEDSQDLPSEERKKSKSQSTGGPRKKSSYEGNFAGEFEEEEGEGEDEIIVPDKETVEKVVIPPDETLEQEQHQTYGKFGNAGEKSKRFISCDTDFYKDLNDFSTFKTLLECPALLTIGNNGALDLTKWVETYLDCKGLTAAAGEGMMIGQLKDWNFVEEYLPIQMIQVLSEAIGNYLSLQRMYCPFYDTVLFIFNNPTPYSLQSDSNFVSKIHTLPGLQHFLEYTINDEEVLQWIMQLEQKKGVEIVDSFSADTLMKIVPDDQWVLAPSIKEKIVKRKLAQERKADELEKIKMEKNYHRTISKKRVEENDPKRRRSKYDADKVKISDDAALPSSDDKKRKNSGKKTKKSGLDGMKKSSNKGDDEKKESKIAAEDVKKDKTSKLTEDQKLLKEDDASNVDSGIGTKEKSARSKSRKQSFNFTDAIKYSKGLKHPPQEKKKALFHCYDLGKRMIITAVDTYHMFPLDGSIIQYEIATIEPEYRMMQLSITKNGHQSFFYPYYIPQDLDLSTESYVVIPYFHMVHSNGTIFAFQDQRAKEAAPYIRYCLKTKTHTKKFSYDKIFFANDLAEERRKAKHPRTSTHDETPLGDHLQDGSAKPSDNIDEIIANNGHGADADAVVDDDADIEGEPELRAKSDEGLEPKKELEEESKINIDSKKGKKGKDKDKDKTKKDKSDKKKATKDKTASTKTSNSHDKHGKDTASLSDLEHDHASKEDEHENEQEHKSPEIFGFQEDLTGEWIYPESEGSDEEVGGKRKKSVYSHTWEDAVKIITPLVHSFKITLPSGLIIQISDGHGLPLSREIKQWYADKGSATSLIESSRYYTSNGSVVKFMMNSTIQVINARGVTTTVREVSANINREKNNIRRIFSKATAVKVYEGEVILPTGEYWKISKGSKLYHNPLFLFAGGQLPGGETFCRRQDGVIYLHRHDGTVICHYPDGTRFTTRMLIMRDPVEEFEDWVFVGMKTMVEHPSYATILFNSLSGNVHLKLQNNEWVRIFADGSIQLGTVDEYTLDVDKNRALLSYPSCSAGNCGDKKIPNVTSVKLFHTSIFAEATAVITPEEFKKKYEIKSPEPVIEVDPERGRSSVSVDSVIHRSDRSPSSAIEINSSRMDFNKNPRHSSADHLNLKNANYLDENLGEEEMAEENEAPTTEEHHHMHSENRRKHNEAEEKAEQVRLEVDEFLQFTDTWTFCKSIDSWDNKFAITVFGDKTVTKSDRFQKEMCVSTESLLNTFSLARQQSQGLFLPGILPSTSSENLVNLSKRISAFRQGKIGDCGKLPKTKIFVVKRDLSGYQFLKHAEVESVLRKVRSHRESVVVVDTLPNTPPRKFITIMEPVGISEKPNGMWLHAYREPIFRPKILNNKQLQIARPEDLRWFGYVLSTAHTKRPKFYADPKTRFLAKKSISTKSPESLNIDPSDSKRESLIIAESVMEMGHFGSLEANADELGAEGEAQNAEEAPAPQDTEQAVAAGANSSEGTAEAKKHKKDLGRKSKETKKDKKKKKEAAKNKSNHDGKDKKSHSFDSQSGEKQNENKKAPEKVTAVKEPPQELKQSSFFPVEPSYGEYPEDVLDVDGIYNVEDDKPKISNKEHAELCIRHKSIVVRNFMEIPQIDETLQSMLISASMCYGKMVDNQMSIYKTYELDNPDFEDERKRQKFIKQQLIEQNLEEMHLYEQAQGNVLSFHF